MISRKLTITLALFSVASIAMGLDSITLNVGPGASVVGAMGKVESEGTLTFTTTTLAPDHWIQSLDPRPTAEVVYTALPKASPCPEDAKKFRTWPYKVVPANSNADMLANPKGAVPLCKGGDGGVDSPEFSGTIVHADLDVDSDNDSLYGGGSVVSEGQKTPSRSATEDAGEEAGNGILIPFNAGFEEGGTANNLPQQDWEQDGIVLNDPDLSVAKLEIKGASGTATMTFDASIRLWKEDLTEIKSGVGFAVAPGVITYLMEGIKAEAGKITVVFAPASGVGTSKDVIAYTVVRVQIVDEKNNIRAEQNTDEKVSIRARLATVITPAALSSASTAWKWTIGGDRIKTFEHDIDEAAKHKETALAAGDLEKADVKFFWQKESKPGFHQVTVMVSVTPYTTIRCITNFSVDDPVDPSRNVYCSYSSARDADRVPNGEGKTFDVLLAHENWHEVKPMDDGDAPVESVGEIFGGIPETNNGQAFLLWHWEFLKAHLAWESTFNFVAAPAFNYAPPKPKYLTKAPTGKAEYSDQYKYVRIGEFQNLQELGQDTNLPWHGNGHANEEANGDPDMGTLRSPGAVGRKFWMWHAMVDTVRQDWKVDVAKVTSMTPATGAVETTFPAVFSVTFDRPVSFFPSAAAPDLNVIGFSLTSITVDGIPLAPVGRMITLDALTHTLTFNASTLPPAGAVIEYTVRLHGTASFESKEWKFKVQAP